jgi:alkylation response protein AidB-like acyl-CoA dehydrogenase
MSGKKSGSPGEVDLLSEGPPQGATEMLFSRAASIAGGTSEIQKNIIAQRLLGLPRT